MTPGGRAVYTTHRPAGYPSRDVVSLRDRSGQLSRLDSHQLDSSLVGCSFPSPVLASALTVIFRMLVFPCRQRLKRWHAYTPDVHSSPAPSLRSRATADPQHCVWVRAESSEPPSAQSPFARRGATRDGAASRAASGDVTPPSKLVRAHAPVPPPLIAFGLPYASSLRRLLPSPAGRGTFPTLSPASLRRRLDPYPAVSPRCIHPFLLWGRRPHVSGKTFGTREDPCHATSTGNRISGLQSFADVQSPPLARPPGRTHRGARRHRAAGPFTPRIARRVTPAGMWHRYVTDLGNCHGWTRTSWIPVLSAAPSQVRFWPRL